MNSVKSSNLSAYNVNTTILNWWLGVGGGPQLLVWRSFDCVHPRMFLRILRVQNVILLLYGHLPFSSSALWRGRNRMPDDGIRVFFSRLGSLSFVLVPVPWYPTPIPSLYARTPTSQPHPQKMRQRGVRGLGLEVGTSWSRDIRSMPEPSFRRPWP